MFHLVTTVYNQQNKSRQGYYSKRVFRDTKFGWVRVVWWEDILEYSNKTTDRAEAVGRFVSVH